MSLGPPIVFGRHPPSVKEQARRIAWGVKWGKVGHEWMVAHYLKAS